MVHLDGLYYGQEWNVRPEAQSLALQQDAVRGQGWVIDGNHLRSMPLRLAAADTVIYLDVSAVACLWGIARRRWRFRGGQHPAEGVFDRITAGFNGIRGELQPKFATTDTHSAGASRITGRGASPARPPGSTQVPA